MCGNAEGYRVNQGNSHWEGVRPTERKYSCAECTGTKTKIVSGDPNQNLFPHLMLKTKPKDAHAHAKIYKTYKRFQ